MTTSRDINPEEPGKRAKDTAGRLGDEASRRAEDTTSQVRRSYSQPEPARTGIPKWLLPLLAALIIGGLLWWWLASRNNNDDKTPSPTPSPSVSHTAAGMGTGIADGHLVIAV